MTLGKSVDKVDGIGLVTGKPVYTDDIALREKDCLTIKILRSPYAYARIKSINTEYAEKIPGVETILTYKDVPESRFTFAGQSYPETSPYDRKILDEYVRHVGDAVAIIAADTEEIAIKAMKQIKVTYEELEPVLDFETALDNKVLVHRENPESLADFANYDSKRNLVSYREDAMGSVEEGFKDSDIILEESYFTPAQAHSAMEPYTSYAFMDVYDRLNVISSTQIPFHVRRMLSTALEIPKTKIRVTKPRIGGGFGGKQTSNLEVYTGIVTLKTGKPSKIIYDRHECFVATTTRHAMKINVKLGADKEGNIKAIEMNVLSDQGAYGEHGFATVGLVGEKTMPLYGKAKHMKFTGTVVYTNKVVGGAFRGFGATQGTFALESAINKLAHKLNMDPIEVRMKNISKEGDYIELFDKHIDSSTLDKCILRGKELIGWEEKYKPKKLANGNIRALGMAITMQGSGIANIDNASAEIKLLDDGIYQLLLGASDIGTGSDTILTQMAAEILEAPMSRFIVHSADTDISPYDPGAYASSTTYVTGMAVVKAAKELRKKIMETGARMLGVSIEDVDFDGENVTINAKAIKGSENSYRELNCGKEEMVAEINPVDSAPKSISLEEIGKDLVVGAEKDHLEGFATYGSKTSPPPFMAGFAEIEVDKGTGKVIPINYVGVVDCGTVINPKLARIQTEGGLVQGIGFALYEEVRYDNRGKLETDNFMNYKIPSRSDIFNLDVEFIPSYEPTGPFGAKSIGEIVVNTPAPAIAAAIYNAVGVNINSLPMTPEKVFLAINNK